MKTILKLEEAAQFGLSIYLFSLLPITWWWYLALFLAPDLSMLGYLVSPSVGAVCYNVAHHKGIAIIIGLIGFMLNMPWLLFAGILLFGHSSFDRMMGYGLKHLDSFNNTHLGLIGKAVKTL